MNRIVSHRWPGGLNSLELSLLFAVVTMPFGYLWNSYSIDLFAAMALLSNSPARKIRMLRERAFFWILPLCYFVWMALSLFWDGGVAVPGNVIRGLERSVSWFVFPILLGTIDRLDFRSVRKVLLAFVASNIAGSVYCLWKAYLEYRSTNYINVFFYHPLSNHIGISAIYFSMYCVFCIYILFYYFVLKKQSLAVRLACMAVTGYLICFVVMLSSKTMIFVLYLSALIFTVYCFYYFRSKWGALVSLILLVAIPVLLVKFPYVNARLRDTQLKEYHGSADDQNGLAVRGVLWESSWQLITDHPLVGWGRYGSRNALDKKYAEKGFAVGAEENYNSHNQYFYTWLCFGLAGLLILLFYAGSLLSVFLRHHCFLGVSLLLIFLVANITECMLETQKGIVFFFLFANLFLFHVMNRVSGRPGQEVKLFGRS